MHDGSYFAHDDLYVSIDNLVVDAYLNVFRAIFYKSGHAAHYKMMMGDSFVANSKEEQQLEYQYKEVPNNRLLSDKQKLRLKNRLHFCLPQSRTLMYLMTFQLYA